MKLVSATVFFHVVLACAGLVSPNLFHAVVVFV